MFNNKKQTINEHSSTMTQSPLGTYIIVDMQKHHFKHIYNIADRQLGQDYVTDDLLNQCLINNHQYIGRTAIDKKTLKVVGFCISISLNKDDISNLLNVDDDALPHFFKEANQYGVIKTIAVNREYKGLGIGTKLIEDALNIFAADYCDHVFTVAWKSSLGINLHGVLMKTQFKRFIEIPHFWYQSSIESGCHCSVCGKPPCVCSAVIYGKHLIKKGR